MYGGGNIGRGFIGAMLSASGYHVTFIDIAENVVNALNERHEYPVRLVSEKGVEDTLVTNVGAVNGNDTEEAARAIAGCDILATSVGARILRFIVPNIVAGLRLRWQQTEKPLNILICENLNDADKVLYELLTAPLSEDEKKLFDERVGLVECSVGRMVPVQTDEMKDGDELRICTEPYPYLPVDKAAFKGDIPEINNMIPYSPFDYYVKRKLFIHNLGHAVCAYLGGYSGREYIAQSVSDAEIFAVTQNAMLESAQALSVKYGAELLSLVTHIDDLLSRFGNGILHDTCQRVGGDPARKLGQTDRLIGASRLCLECGVTPAYISAGAAGAVYRCLNENALEQTEENAARVLCEVSGLGMNDRLFEMIMRCYAVFRKGEPLSALRKAAGKIKAENSESAV